MGSFGNLLGVGTGNGQQGAAWTAASAGPAQQANLQNPVSADQAVAAQTTATGALTQQQAQYGQQQQLASALAAQNGIGNQSSVFNQLQGVANGTGPNPAQAMLAQQTGANTANQAALMAGQRGAGANVGLMARQAAQQGAANQQQAVGQGATMQANQSLGALGQLGGIAGQQVAQQQNAVGANTAAAQGLTNAAQANQGQMLGQIGAQNQAALAQAQNTNTFNTSNTSSQNTANAAIQAGNQKAQAGALQGLGNAASSALGMIGAAHGGVIPKYATGTPNPISSNDSAGADMEAAMNAPQQPIATPKAPSIKSGPMSKLAQSITSGGAPDSGIEGAVSGGVTNFGNALVGAAGKALGPSASSTPSDSASSGQDMMDAMNAPMNKAGGGRIGYAGGGSPLFNLTGDAPAPSSGGGGMDPSALAGAMAAKGGKAQKKVPAMVSPGEIYLKPGAAQEVAKGKKSPMSGEHIKGQAKVKGDSYANDTVPKTLDEGGVVIPRSILEGKSPHAAAYKFVNAALSKAGKRK